MAVFRDAEHVYRCFGGLFRQALEDKEMAQKVGESHLVIRFDYSDPEASITVNAKTPPPGVPFAIIEGECDLKPDVRMTMKADVAHEFWLGKVNLLAALTRGTMKAQGPIQSILKLLPAIKPAFDLYKAYLKEIGEENLMA